MENKLQTNLDTDLIKLVAIISMFIDHLGAVIFPQYIFMRWIGRLAFPLFCYTMTVGLVYTHDIKSYIKRIGIFALISQPFYVLAFHGNDFSKEGFWASILDPNILFTLFLSLIFMYGFVNRKVAVAIVAMLPLLLFDFDYNTLGIMLMLIFYCFREKKSLSLMFFVISYLPSIIFTSPMNIYNLNIFGLTLGGEIFCLLAIPLIYLNTRSKLKIPKYFFYIFYPAHLFAIYLINIFIN